MNDLLSESRNAIERANALLKQNKELRAELNETKQHLREARAAARRISPEVTAKLKRDMTEGKKKPKSERQVKVPARAA